MNFLDALNGLGNLSSRGLFINSCYVHCQSEIQETWFTVDSPMLNKTVSSIFTYDKQSSICSPCFFIAKIMSIWDLALCSCGLSNDIVLVQRIATAVGDWFYGRRAFAAIDCAYPCDSTCHNNVSSDGVSEE